MFSYLIPSDHEVIVIVQFLYIFVYIHIHLSYLESNFPIM